MKKVFEFFAKKHVLAILITVMIIFLGIRTILTIQRDVYPSVDFGEMVIETSCEGLSAEDVEKTVTNKIEKELRSVSGIQNYISVSLDNISFIDCNKLYNGLFNFLFPNPLLI